MDDVRLLSVRRLAAEGLSFLDGRRQPQASAPAKANAAFDEIALQLHYFREEFAPALRCVDRLTTDDPTPTDRRIMLAILRAQCLEAKGSPSLARLSLEPTLEGPALRDVRFATGSSAEDRHVATACLTRGARWSVSRISKDGVCGAATAHSFKPIPSASSR
jgi:hypothetical protein